MPRAKAITKPESGEESWKACLPCTRAEAEALTEDSLFDAGSDSVPTVVTREIDPARPDEWSIDVYFASKPTTAMLRAVSALAPSAAITPVLEKLDDEDWVTMSQQGLEPLRAGRFHVHISTSAPLNDPALHNICIDAGQAFGTGHHETTLGCLETLDHLKGRGKVFRNIIDVGTGTGLLAFAARHLWPHAKILASDIDPVAVEVGRRNADLNDIPMGHGRGAVRLLQSNGLNAIGIQRRAPFDLIIANILAGPLVSLAPQVAAAARPGTTLILAGLLSGQKNQVLHAYHKTGFRLRATRLENEWPCLILVKTWRYGWRRPEPRRKSPLADDYFGEC